MATDSLSKLVRIYLRKHGPPLDAYLDHYHQLENLDDAIRQACHGKDEKIHSHQHLIGKKKLDQAYKKLRKHAIEIAASESFDNLLTKVDCFTAAIDRFGVLAVYDTSLRLGAFLDVWPELVYLHAGTRKGCKKLGVEARGSTVKMEHLPQAIQVLKPYQAEDFLCIFKDQFGGPGDMVVVPSVC